MSVRANSLLFQESAAAPSQLSWPVPSPLPLQADPAFKTETPAWLSPTVVLIAGDTGSSIVTPTAMCTDIYPSVRDPRLSRGF